MAHDECAGIGPGGEAIVLAAIDLHLVLVEAVPQVAGHDVQRLMKSTGCVDAERLVGKMRGLRFRDGRRHTGGGQSVPDGWQFLHHGAVAVTLWDRVLLPAVSSRERSVKDIEAAILGKNHHDVLDGVDTGRGALRVQSGGDRGEGDRAEKSRLSASQHVVKPYITKS